MAFIGDQAVILGYVALAAILCALIGLEREISDKPAGIRTHALVGGAAALLVSLSEALIDALNIGQNSLNSDPVRIVEAVVAGVSFLGAGTILRRPQSDQIEGLTTAASLLFAAAIGISVAVHQLVIAVGATVLVLLILVSGEWLGRWRTTAK